MNGSPGPREWCAVAAIAFLQLTLLVGIAARVGVTVDEPSHLLSSRLYWSGEDKLAPRDMPPLLKIFAGAVASRFEIPIPRDHASWKKQNEWEIALEMMERMNRAQIEQVFFWARLPMTFFPVACALLLWWWARQLFSWPAAVAAQAILALSPTALGHGALVKNDMAAAFGYLLFWYAAWRWWRSPEWKHAAMVGIGLAAAMLAKMSMLILPPIAVLGVLLRARSLGVKRAIATLALVLLIPYVSALAGWQFEVRRLGRADIEICRQDAHLPSWACDVGTVFQAVPLPQPLWDGFLGLLRSNDVPPGVYFLGSTQTRGLPAYFVVALLVKLTEFALLLFFAGAATLLWRLWRRRLDASCVFWTVPAFLYIGLASGANLQLGVRLVLPALPFLVLIGTYALDFAAPRLRTFLCAAIILLAAVKAVQVFPNGISYFNAFAGGPDNGIAWLSDSNLDWGQSLRDLRHEVTDRRIKFLRVCYFGTDNLWAYFTDREVEQITPPWNAAFAQGPHYQPQPGWYAISATHVTGQLFPREYRDYFQVFRTLRPVAKAGYSIFLYEIPDPATTRDRPVESSSQVVR